MGEHDAADAGREEKVPRVSVENLTRLLDASATTRDGNASRELRLGRDLRDARAALANRDAVLARMRAGCAKDDQDVCQVLGRVLDYPRFADDQQNFPGAVDADGVCVGEHVAVTIAYEAARKITELRAALAAAKEQGRQEGFAEGRAAVSAFAEKRCSEFNKQADSAALHGNYIAVRHWHGCAEGAALVADKCRALTPEPSHD